MVEKDSSSLDDSALIARAKAGDSEAFGQLYERYLEPIYRYVYSFVDNPRDAEDLTEQVFLQAYQALGSYRPRGHPFSAFLYRVARNMLIDHHRGRKEELPFELAEGVGQSTELRRLGDQLVAEADNKALREAMRALPPDYSEVIRLRMLLSLSTQTVAAWMGRSEGSIRVLQHRALKALRKKLTEQ